MPRARAPHAPRRSDRASRGGRRARSATDDSPRATAPQAVDLRLLRSELGQDTAETERVLAERGAHPLITGGRRVALVEHEVDHLEHRRQSGLELVSRWNLERDARRGEGPLGPDDALGD